ncbi:kinetochore protein Spc24 isoform X1 [Diceros bicornis minor]|uniref:kinetochore protein Spc24 isoform X1 n=1 Tax=Diceros bicornis minor TaxID=77932 RepID=UPI0026EB8318|nr:kinetochore protein Spc24 isoform X1 [Diceros bicornis minor]
MAAFRDMEEVSQGLLSLLGTNRAEAQQRRLLGRHEQVVERLLETQDGAEQRLREILDAEKEVAQGLLDAKEQAQQAATQLQQLEAELQRAGEEDACLKASLLYPFLRAGKLGACPGGGSSFTPENVLGARGPRPAWRVSTCSPPATARLLNCPPHSAHPGAGGAQRDRGRPGETGEGRGRGHDGHHPLSRVRGSALSPNQ